MWNYLTFTVGGCSKHLESLSARPLDLSLDYIDPLVAIIESEKSEVLNELKEVFRSHQNQNIFIEEFRFVSHFNVNLRINEKNNKHKQ